MSITQKLRDTFERGCGKPLADVSMEHLQRINYFPGLNPAVAKDAREITRQYKANPKRYDPKPHEVIDAELTLLLEDID